MKTFGVNNDKLDGMSHEQVINHLNKICIHCGEYLGRHKANDLNCPVTEGVRTLGYKDHQWFKEWKDEPTN